MGARSAHRELFRKWQAKGTNFWIGIDIAVAIEYRFRSALPDSDFFSARNKNVPQ